ncbi:uncharacterized protein G6M90_00g045580 [Metarhizium brunneum]|uniref:Uncharacterized protein n=1 Tax=Metarhizium brunneum TaxID=500148 RepID=A0A7D5UYA7_9HYPO|nr:hypothetical protein G6M90_00g045580 [Metarhizium brunneum]
MGVSLRQYFRDRLEQIFGADSEFRLMELFLFHLRQTGYTLQQLFLRSLAFGTVDPANLEIIFSSNFKESDPNPIKSDLKQATQNLSRCLSNSSLFKKQTRIPFGDPSTTGKRQSNANVLFSHILLMMWRIFLGLRLQSSTIIGTWTAQQEDGAFMADWDDNPLKTEFENMAPNNDQLVKPWKTSCAVMRCSPVSIISPRHFLTYSNQENDDDDDKNHSQ